MRLKQNLCSLSLSILLVTSVPVVAFADENVSIPDTQMKQAVHEKYHISKNFVDDLSSKDLLGYFSNIPNLESASYDEKYYKIEYVPKSDLLSIQSNLEPQNYTKTVTETSKEEAERAVALQNNYSSDITPFGTVTTTTSWLKLETSISKYTTNTGGASARFEWLTSPFFRGTDALALGLNANSSVVPGSSSALYKYTFYTDSGNIVTDQIDYTHPNTDASIGISYNMSLTKTSNSLYHAGYMKFTFQPNVSTLTVADAYSLYAHAESALSVAPSVSFPGGGSVRVSPESKFDTVPGHASIQW
ncbi:hypothetical protein MHH60_10000 [Paenibacillus sp. FSL H7-0716]|uniref:Uncharacterized protein n=1 Tax=Paenibacillus odorifer TaxID=189426 RepID=A0AB36J809_9BACL|nr:hypothetical protein [Paenibacillus odorifer]OME15838.1 hypothetical protein BSK47_21335 [Paenibacillus odorifer]